MSTLQKYGVIFFLTSVFAVILYLTTYFPFKACDDAYIYFVYAKNFSNGHGFVYNPGGEKVEGFTSTLWMWIVILFYNISSQHFYILLFILNCLTISYALYRVVKFIDKYYVNSFSSLPSLTSLFLVVILFVIKGYADWTIFSLLEIGLWSSILVVLGIFLMEMAAGETKTSREQNFFALLIMLLVLTRPESMLWGICLITIYGFLHFSAGAHGFDLFRLVVKPFMVFTLTLLTLTILRLFYFGFPLPNTYYAKVSADKIENLKQGLIYVGKFVFIYPLYYLSIVIGVVLVVRLFRQISKFKRLEVGLLMTLYLNAVLIAITLLIPLANGGDHFSLFRLFQPTIPFFILLFFNPLFLNLLYDKWTAGNRWKVGLFIVVVPFLYLINIPKYLMSADKMPYKVSLLNDFSIAEANRQESIWLNDFFDFPQKPSIGRIWAGAYAFAYEGKTIDLMGLNDVRMAHAQPVKVGLKNHAAFDMNTFFELKPDFLGGLLVDDTANFIMPENKADFRNSLEYGVYKGIYDEPRFRNLYSPVLIARAGQTRAYFTYARNEYISALRAQGMVVLMLERESPVKSKELINAAESNYPLIP